MSFREINDLDDLNFLKDNKISEGIDLDYKKKLPDLKSDASRLEFLRDICSFANAHGGQILYGIEEQSGAAIPREVCGVELENPDRDIRKLIDIVRDGLEVTLSGVRFKNISLSNGNYVVVIKIPMSLSPPHRVKANLDKDHRFYGRNDLEKYELSFHEIRDKFMQSTTIKDKIRKFRQERIDLIKARNTPLQYQLKPGPKIALHIIPLTAFSSLLECQPVQIKGLYQAEDTYYWFMPLGCDHGGTKQQINLDGFLTYQTAGYVQIFHEGIVEAVTTVPQPAEGERSLHSGFYEVAFLKQKYIDILKKLGFNPPFYIFLSLLEIDGCSLATFVRHGLSGAYNVSSQKFNKPEILSREVVFESFDDSLECLFRPLFDRFFNAWGFEKCINYNNDGSYNYQN